MNASPVSSGELSSKEYMLYEHILAGIKSEKFKFESEPEQGGGWATISGVKEEPQKFIEGLGLKIIAQ